MPFYGGGGATVSFAGGGSGSAAGANQYAYVNNSGTVSYTTEPINYVAQGYNPKTGDNNPGLIVGQQTGTIYAGPGTGGTYNPATNSTIPPPSPPSTNGASVGVTGTNSLAVPSLSTTDLLLIGGAVVGLLVVLVLVTRK